MSLKEKKSKSPLKSPYLEITYPGDSVDLPAMQETALIPGSGRSPREGNAKPPQDSCLGNPMDRGVCWAAVQGVAKSRTRLRD